MSSCVFGSREWVVLNGRKSRVNWLVSDLHDVVRWLQTQRFEIEWLLTLNVIQSERYFTFVKSPTHSSDFCVVSVLADCHLCFMLFIFHRTSNFVSRPTGFYWLCYVSRVLLFLLWGSWIFRFTSGKSTCEYSSEAEVLASAAWTTFLWLTC
jgi:hypothetical protein